MTLKGIPVCAMVVIVGFLLPSSRSEGSQLPSESDRQEYAQDMARISSLQASLGAATENNLEEYETFAEGLHIKWRQRNKEEHARLMLKLCEPISSGAFEDERRFQVARRYALSALADSNEIPLQLELELTGHVMTQTIKPLAQAPKDFAECRKADVEVRLHAWKRLIGAIDPNWDPNEEILSPNAVSANLGLPSGIAPGAVKDAKLRAEYEAALQRQRQKTEWYTNQYRLHDWLIRYPKRAEAYIIQLYSKPPFNVDELTKLLNQYRIPEQAKTRILDAVAKNMQEEARKAPPDQGYKQP